jgi:type VI secretion system secreted protein VgrG
MSKRNLHVTIASGDSFDVRQFSVVERMSSLFEITLLAVSENPDVDFEAAVGQAASFSMGGEGEGSPGLRGWTGLCSELQQLQVEEGGLSTYHLVIVPSLWLLTQRRNHRMFQQKSELDIALQLLHEWGIKPEKRLSSAYKKRKYRVQYGESDFAFLSRLLEDAGISFFFEAHEGESRLVLSDAPHAAEAHAPIPFRDAPTTADRHHVSSVRVGRKVRPGKYTMRDHDYRKDPSFKLLAGAAAKASEVESQLERFHYTPGAFLFGADKGDSTPHADDKGKTRTDEGEAATLAQKRLDAKRSSARTISFETNVLDLGPGVVTTILDHPRSDLGKSKRLLVIETARHGTFGGEWSTHVEARSAEVAYHPPLSTRKPTAVGVESATVVGPTGEEIHTDEFGRVRVHFHWDRESKMDDNSSCWIHVSQSWGGSGYGGSNLPRIGQEVLVDFLGGDPDRPIITGRVYTNLQKTPYGLPANKTQSGWKSNSTGGTGGYNEIMFEDAGGKELLRMQAEKDMHKLVKNDEDSTVGRNRSRLVKGNEDITIGKSLSKNVALNEREVTGLNRNISVGVNRSASIGAIDSTVAGTSIVYMVSPPGEGGGDGTSQLIQNDRIVLSTPGGASITLEGSSIRLSAESISLIAGKDLTALGEVSGLFASGTGDAYFGSGSGEVRLNANGNKLSVTGSSGLDLSSSGGTVNITGGPMVMVNPSGALFSGRVMDLAPDQITKGAATVLVGGPQFEYEVKRLHDGRVQVGKHIFINADPARPNYQSEVLGAMGIMSTTPSGRTQLANIEGSRHNVDISYYSEMNGGTSWRDGAAASNPSRGTDASVQWNPDYQSPNPLDPNNLSGSDATLFHELGHASHVVNGRVDKTETHDNWDDNEERNTINDVYPAENDYLHDRGFPYARPDHRFTTVPADQRPPKGSHAP